MIASIFETEIEGYAEVAGRLSGVPRVAGLEVNASCPHVKSGGIEFGQNPAVLASLVRTVRRATARPLLVKLSPNVTDIAEMARVCEGEGADGISPDQRRAGPRGGRRDPPPRALQRPRGAVGAGHPADRAPDGLAGLPGRFAPDLRHRRHRERRRRHQVPAVRRDGRPGGDRATTSTPRWPGRWPTASWPIWRATASPARRTWSGRWRFPSADFADCVLPGIWIDYAGLREHPRVVPAGRDSEPLSAELGWVPARRAGVESGLMSAFFVCGLEAVCRSE